MRKVRNPEDHSFGDAREVRDKNSPDNDPLTLDQVIQNVVDKLTDKDDGAAADPKLAEWYEDWCRQDGQN